MIALLPWHQSAWDQIQSQIGDDRLPHALLLQGTQGSGRRQFADALCAYLICDSAAQTRPCGSCRQCLLYDSGNHPDVLVVEPEEGSHNIKIDQVRRVSQFVVQTSNQSGATKLIVLGPAEALGPAAANSLLKSLEEPPGKTLFILLAEPGRTLLPTIRSRCQPVALNAASDDQAMEWLQEHSSSAPEELQRALQLAPGRPLEALKLLEQGIPAWRLLLEEQLMDLAAGRLSAVELAKIASAQPALRAIQLIEDISAEESRQQASGNQMAALRAGLAFQQKLVPLKRQLAGTANPNELMALEYLFSAYADLLRSRQSA